MLGHLNCDPCPFSPLNLFHFELWTIVNKSKTVTLLEIQEALSVVPELRAVYFLQ